MCCQLTHPSTPFPAPQVLQLQHDMALLKDSLAQKDAELAAALAAAQAAADEAQRATAAAAAAAPRAAPAVGASPAAGLAPGGATPATPSTPVSIGSLTEMAEAMRQRVTATAPGAPCLTSCSCMLLDCGLATCMRPPGCDSHDT